LVSLRRAPDTDAKEPLVGTALDVERVAAAGRHTTHLLEAGELEIDIPKRKPCASQPVARMAHSRHINDEDTSRAKQESVQRARQVGMIVEHSDRDDDVEIVRVGVKDIHDFGHQRIGRTGEPCGRLMQRVGRQIFQANLCGPVGERGSQALAVTAAGRQRRMIRIRSFSPWRNTKLPQKLDREGYMSSKYAFRGWCAFMVRSLEANGIATACGE